MDGLVALRIYASLLVVGSDSLSLLPSLSPRRSMLTLLVSRISNYGDGRSVDGRRPIASHCRSVGGDGGTRHCQLPAAGIGSGRQVMTLAASR